MNNNLREQLSKGTADFLYEILKHFRKQAQENVTVILDKQRKEDTSVSINGDTQQSNMQEHTANWIPANSEQEHTSSQEQRQGR